MKEIVIKYGVAVTLVAVAVPLALVIEPLVDEARYPPFVAAVMVSAWNGGLGPGLVATALSTLASNYFLVPPIHSVLVRPEDLPRVILFVLLSLLISSLTGSQRRAEARAHEQEHELRQSRDQLAIVLRSVIDGITLQAPDGRLLYANDAAAQIIGYPSADSLLATPVADVMRRFEVLDEQGNPLPLTELPGRRALQGTTIPEMLVRFRIVASGEERWSRVSASPITDAQGHVQFVVNVFHDVTARQRAETDRAQLLAREQAARAQAEVGQQRLAFLAEASSMLASSLDYEAILANVGRLAVPRIADWCSINLVGPDGAFQRVSGTHVDPSKQQILDDLRRHYPPRPTDPSLTATMPPVDRPVLIATIEDAHLRAFAQHPEQLRVYTELGFQSAMLVPMRAAEQYLGLLIFATDVSGRHYGPDDLALAEDLAGRAAVAVENARLYREVRDAVQVRNEFLSIAAHELRTPVTALLGYTQVLQRRLGKTGTLNARDRRALSVIEDQAERLSKPVNALLDVSRIETGQFTLERSNLDLRLLAQRVVEDVQPSLDRHNIQLHNPRTPVIVDGDAARLEQVLQNLVQNAVKYSPDGGPIDIRVEANDGEALIGVSDRGIGIPEDAQGQLFQRFYRASNVSSSNFSGMGLGLYVVQEIVNRHGGTIEVQSTEGVGSTFTMRLPVLQTTAPHARTT